MSGVVKDLITFTVWLTTIAFTVVGGIILSLKVWPEEFWVGWEVAALIATLIFCVYMTIEWFLLPPRLNRVIRDSATLFAILSSLLGIASLTVALFFSRYTASSLAGFAPPEVIDVMEPYWTFFHALLLLLASLCYLTLNAIVCLFPRRDAEIPNEYEMLRSETTDAIKFADIPTVIAFTIITVYMYLVIENGLEQKYLKIFLGGVVSFQLLYSNIIFGSGLVTRLYHQIRGDA